MPIGPKLEWTLSLPFSGSQGRAWEKWPWVSHPCPDIILIAKKKNQGIFCTEVRACFPRKMVKMAGSRVCHPLATWRVETGCRSRYLPCLAGVGCATTRSPMQGAVTRLQNGLGRAGKRGAWPRINSSLTRPARESLPSDGTLDRPEHGSG